MAYDLVYQLVQIASAMNMPIVDISYSGRYYQGTIGYEKDGEFIAFLQAEPITAKKGVKLDSLLWMESANALSLGLDAKITHQRVKVNNPIRENLRIVENIA